MSLTKRKTALILGLLGSLVAFGAAATPAFAWTSTLGTCVGSYTSSTYPANCTLNPSYNLGTTTTVSDTAKLTLTNDGPAYGTVTFAVASGTCSDHGAGSTVGVTGSSQSAMGASWPPYPSTTSSYYTASIPTTMIPHAGSYVWLVSYSGTKDQWGNQLYPSASDCEQFTLTGTFPPPPSGVPQFPAGMALLMALAVPAMLLVRSKSKVISA